MIRRRARPRVRLLLAALLVLALVPPVVAQEAGPAATLEIAVQDDHAERMTLGFDGLRRLTQYQGICLPANATETRVYDDVGDVEYEAGTDEEGRRSLSFLARSETLRVDMTRPARETAEHPLYSGDANFCVPAKSRVEVVVRVPDQHTLFFMSEGGAITDGREGRATSDGPAHVFYSYEAPLGDAPLRVLDEGDFRVFVATDLAAEAQEVARLASPPFRAALAEAGLEAPFDTVRVRFAPQTPFAWEAGHYNGHGFVSVKEEALAGDATDGFPYSAVKVLVHESFHAASFPHGKGPVEDAVAWWLEGTARHAERQVDTTMPNATRHCTTSATEVRCYDFDDRIKRADLETGYDAAFVFDPDWEPSAPQSDDTRRFYYAYSEYVVASWIARHGDERYRQAWDDIEAAFFRGEGCPCADGWLESVLDDPTLFEPWADVKATEPQRFETLVKPLVKDEEALQRELDARSNPFSQVPAPGALVAMAALAAAAGVAWRRR